MYEKFSKVPFLGIRFNEPEYISSTGLNEQEIIQIKGIKKIAEPNNKRV